MDIEPPGFALFVVLAFLSSLFLLWHLQYKTKAGNKFILCANEGETPTVLIIKQGLLR